MATVKLGLGTTLGQSALDTPTIYGVAACARVLSSQQTVLLAWTGRTPVHPTVWAGRGQPAVHRQTAAAHRAQALSSQQTVLLAWTGRTPAHPTVWAGRGQPAVHRQTAAALSNVER